MTENYPKISASQLFCIMILSRLSAEIVYPRTASATPTEAVVAVIISEVIRFLLALPLIVYSYKGNNIHRAVYNKNKFFGWTGAIFAALLLLAASLRTLINLSQFASKNLVPDAPLWLIFTIAAAFAVCSAFMGTEALARSGAIFLIAAAVVTLSVMLADIPFINRASFESFSDPGDNSALLSDIFERVIRGGDYLIFAAMLPYVTTKHHSGLGRTAVLFTLFSAVFVLMICCAECLILREMYGQCEFPFLAAASLSDISLFKRLDGFAAAVWALAAAFRSSVMLLSAENALAEVYRAGHAPRKEATP